MCDLMKLIKPLVDESWLSTGFEPASSGWMTLASCLPSSTLKVEQKSWFSMITIIIKFIWGICELRPLPLRPRMDTSALFEEGTSAPRQDTSAPRKKQARKIRLA